MKINILLPVFNDWESLNYLLKDLEKVKNNNKTNLSIEVTVIDDCSSIYQKINEKLLDFHIKIIRLNNNVGSQKAINIGLKYLQENKIDFDYCLIMDSDGEDKAEDLIKLVNCAEENKGKIIFSSRGKRQDGFIFYLFYKIYLFFFYILTGQNINFGNFSCLPKNIINEVINLKYREIHHSASILKSKLPYKKIKCNRGKRFMGKSKMSLKNLVFHGLNGMAIFFKIILVRLFILSILLIFISAISWTSNASFVLINFILILIFSFFLFFLKHLNIKIDKINDKQIKLEDIINNF